MAIFKSRSLTANNLDPEPYVWGGERYSASALLIESGNGYAVGSPEAARWLRENADHDPRLEFEPTRDPEPWALCSPGVFGVRSATEPEPLAGREWVWAPRRARFDTPVNPILAKFRNSESEGDPVHLVALRWLDSINEPEALDHYTPEQIAHACRVFIRMIRWQQC